VTALFGEVPGRVVVATTSTKDLQKIAQWHDIRMQRLGSLSQEPKLTISAGHDRLDWELEKLRGAFENSLPAIMG
jgi:hypothetical protein